MLKVDDVHTYYGDSYILQGLSLHVEAGEVVAVLGRNGVGKTTLMRSIIGLTPARRGTISFKERDITKESAFRIARLGMGYVPQGRRIFASLSVEENLQATSRKGEGRWTFERVLALFPNLMKRRSQSGSKLSGGEQQMLAAGRALMTNPTLILLDEATEGLAPLMVRELGRVIDALRSAGTAVLLVEQKLGFALRHADRVYVMSKGRIAHHSTVKELEDNEEIKKRYLGV